MRIKLRGTLAPSADPMLNCQNKIDLIELTFRLLWWANAAGHPRA